MAERRARVPSRPGHRAKQRLAEACMAVTARGMAVLTALILAALIAVLAWTSVPSIRAYGAGFVTGSDWRPNELEVPKRDANGHVIREDGETVKETIPPSFGALPVIWGTAVSSLLALLFAAPIGIGAALFLVRVGRERILRPVSFMVEFLAAIPSIAYGMWGLMVLAPLLQNHVEPALRGVLDIPGLHWLFRETIQVGGSEVARELPLTGRDMLCGGLVLGIMILPIVTAVARDVLRAVPRHQVEGSLALGANWWQSSRHMLRCARSGLLGAVMLGIARASGETMAVTMVIGNNNQLKASIFAPAQTMSSLLANEFAETTTEMHRAALTEVALLLLVMSLFFNVVARLLVVGRSSRGLRA
ncbi:MAG TPA: phosphate ABC transporter permease subunit PstC [Planctomycetota bacterium]|nr:phosphate ABC transporter permease subunit PstC [Planctomycetota bacterium]